MSSPGPTEMPTAPMDAVRTLSPEQIAYFRAFGFLRLPGLFRGEIDGISAAFDEVFDRIPCGAEFGDLTAESFTENFAKLSRIDTFQHLNLGRRRAIIPGFIEKSDRLSGLAADPRIAGAVASLLDDVEYLGGEGNVFSCDTSWHCDVYGSSNEHDHVKVFFYLDHLDADSGALRVIPGSHHHGAPFASSLWSNLEDWNNIPEIFGVPWDQIPAYTIPNEPGDVLLGDYRTFHATMNSGEHRRLFTINHRGRFRS